MMEERFEHFRYELLERVPKEFRELDWTYLRLIEKPFAECKDAFDALRRELEPVFAGKPFFHLHFLRAIEDHLISLALSKNEPLSVCLEHLRRRVELEYSRADIAGKAARAVLLADYASKCGEIGLARSLLEQEEEQLREIAEVFRASIENVNERIKRIQER